VHGGGGAAPKVTPSVAGPGAGVAISRHIGLLDLCRPFDSHSELLAAARQRKLRTYGPLLAALRSYLESGWQVLILPWVVGVRGIVEAQSVLEILDFLRVSRQQRAKLAEDVTIESVKALYSLHQIRYHQGTILAPLAPWRCGNPCPAAGPFRP
jgi:hypothetical protein